VTIDPDSVIWSTFDDEQSGRPLLIMLHGYGSNERDLAGLGPELPNYLDFVTVRAPLTVGPDAFAWVPIETPGRPDPEILGVSTEAMLEWMDKNVPSSRPVALLGFSQGGLMVTQLLRYRPERFVCGVVLSGFVLDQELPNDAELGELQVPVFFGRGSHDEVIAPDAFERASAWLPGHANLTEKIYPGLTHSISKEEIDDVASFLDKHLRAHERLS
jgi:phospholipase/carboxylesterase